MVDSESSVRYFEAIPKKKKEKEEEKGGIATLVRIGTFRLRDD